MKELYYQYMMLLPFVQSKISIFLGEPIKVDITRHWAAPQGVVDTLILMHGSQNFARIVVLKLGGSTNQKGRS